VEDIVICDENFDSPIRRRPVVGSVDVDINFVLWPGEAQTWTNPATPDYAEEVGYEIVARDLEFYYYAKLTPEVEAYIEPALRAEVEAWIDNNQELLQELAFEAVLTEEDYL
jgi:hypothetical protein